MECLFAERCRQARAGIRAALAVQLGANFENEAARFLELCEGDLDKVPAMLTQAGCELSPADAHAVECLFAAVTQQHGKTATRLSGHERARKPDISVLLDEDPRWRRGMKTRGVPSPQPVARGMQVNTGLHIVGPSKAPGRSPYCETHALGVPALGSPDRCPRCATARALAAAWPSPCAAPGSARARAPFGSAGRPAPSR